MSRYSDNYDPPEPRRRRDARPRTEGHNTTKPHRIHYSKERTEKERTVKSDRFFQGSNTGSSGGNVIFRAPVRRPPPARPAPPPPPRGRSASPQRRSPSPSPDEPREETEPIDPAARRKRSISSTLPSDKADVEMRDPKATTAPSVKRRLLAEDAASYVLPVGGAACDELDLYAKQGMATDSFCVCV